jgi:hypothetical protein
VNSEISFSQHCQLSELAHRKVFSSNSNRELAVLPDDFPQSLPDSAGENNQIGHDRLLLTSFRLLAQLILCYKKIGKVYSLEYTEIRNIIWSAYVNCVIEYSKVGYLKYNDVQLQFYFITTTHFIGNKNAFRDINFFPRAVLNISKSLIANSNTTQGKNVNLRVYKLFTQGRGNLRGWCPIRGNL